MDINGVSSYSPPPQYYSVQSQQAAREEVREPAPEPRRAEAPPEPAPNRIGQILDIRA